MHLLTDIFAAPFHVLHFLVDVALLAVVATLGWAAYSIYDWVKGGII